MKIQKLGDFKAVIQVHVVLNSVKPAKNQIENADGIAERVWKLLDYDCKAVKNE